MWCVLNCPRGREQEISRICRSLTDGRVIRDVFVFTREQMKRYEGSWHVEEKPLFPGSIFLETEDVPALMRMLGQMFQENGSDGKADIPLRQLHAAEEKFLAELGGRQHHLPMSTGYIRDGVTHVTEGPLKGWENRICKIDRHKRTARLKAPTAWLQNDFVAGLEITSKS